MKLCEVYIEKELINNLDNLHRSNSQRTRH